MRVLIVEDNAIISAHLGKMLERFGYEVPAILASGEEAIQSVEKVQPDVILMDVRLRGDLNGVETGQEIYERLGIPIVFLSAFSFTSLTQLDPSAPFVYLNKPVHEVELQKAVEKVIAMKEYSKTVTDLS